MRACGSRHAMRVPISAGRAPSAGHPPAAGRHDAAPGPVHPGTECPEYPGSPSRSSTPGWHRVCPRFRG
ncbi:hypothetical protein G6F60_014890 [Rhizopus arrhizus]|nr:hypothetical protein G6F60_014890 [Rhizopus arrhizus]